MIDEASSLASARFVSVYLSSPDKQKIWSVEDACVTKRKISNRYGVPDDAKTCRYLVEHPEQRWSFAIRAVWRGGALMMPTAVHTVVESYYADADDIDEMSVKLMVNDWLKSLPL